MFIEIRVPECWELFIDLNVLQCVFCVLGELKLVTKFDRCYIYGDTDWINIALMRKVEIGGQQYVGIHPGSHTHLLVELLL